jgi:hypothetical protein
MRHHFKISAFGFERLFFSEITHPSALKVAYFCPNYEFFLRITGKSAIFARHWVAFLLTPISGKIMRRSVDAPSLFSSRYSTSSRKRKRPHFRFETLEARAMLHGDDDHELPNPHTDPVAAADHASLLSLVPTSAVTHRAVQNGEWDNPTTWDHGVPNANSNVLIPANVDVVLDSIQTSRLRTVRVDGELSFATNVNTQLTVDTLVVTTEGMLEIGTAAAPISSGVSARIVIADRGEIDTHWDPTHLSRGVISHGEVSIYGAELTAFVPVTTSLAAGATTIVLPQTPVGWKAGDRIVLTGSQYGEHDELQINSIAGRTITVDPLEFDHTIPEAGLSLYLANVSRNVVIESENANVIARRGHAMFMHTPNVDINFAGLYGLGRTDKRYDLNSGKLGESGHLIAGTGTNQIGRYSAHFHSTGLQAGAAAAHIRGSAIVDSPGWGVVNHHSNVVAEGNVVFDVLGAAFATETGDEIGAFRGNLAIHSEGSGGHVESRTGNIVQEFAHEGVGFWLQGSGVDVTDNVASGQKQTGFVLYGQGLIENGNRTHFASHNLKNPAWSGGWSAVATGSFPIEFRNNVSNASYTGLVTRYQNEIALSTAKTQIDRFTAWNVQTGIATHYTFQFDFIEPVLLANADADSRSGLIGSGVTREFGIYGGRIEGFLYGLSLPERGTNVVKETHLANVVNLSVTTRSYYESETAIDDVILADSTIPRSIPVAPSDLQIQPLPIYSPREMPVAFRNVSPTYLDDKEIYRPEQAANFVPFKVGTPVNQAPAAFIGKTNRQLFQQYGIAVGGAVAPEDAVPLPESNAIIGSKFTGRRTIQQVSPMLVTAAKYALAYRANAEGPVITESVSENLRPGWNILTRQVDGARYSFLVYADIVGPKFTLSPGSTLAIHPDDISKSFRIRGSIVDDFTTTAFDSAFRLDALPIQIRTDGTRFVRLSVQIRDVAGNVSKQTFDIKIDTNAPRITDTTTPTTVVPTRKLTVTLQSLLVTIQG